MAETKGADYLAAVPTDPRQAPLDKVAYFNSVGGPVSARQSVGALPPGDWLKQRRSFKHPDVGLTMDQAERHAMIRTFAGIYSDRDTLLKSLNSLRNLDVVQTILDVVIDDGFTASEDEPLFRVEYDDPEMAEETRKKWNTEFAGFVEKVNLGGFISSILEDFLLLGEYPFRAEIDDKAGITELVDDLDPLDIAGVYKGTRRKFFVEKKKGKMWIKREEDNVFHFVLSSRKVRIKVAERGDRSKTIPEYFRVGRSFLYPAISKLKKLQIYEMAAVAHYLRTILTPTMVSVGVPAAANPQDIADLTQRYERLVTESKVSMHGEEALDFAKIMEMVGKVVVIPAFSDGKGILTPVDVAGPAPDEGVEAKMRTWVAMAVGIPPYYLSLSGDTGLSKVEALKIYSRYSRKLVMVQEAIEYGIRDVIKAHFQRVTKQTLDWSKIFVKFKSIVNVDLLDNLEYAVASMGVLGDISNTLEQITNNPNLKVKVNSTKFVDIFNKLTRIVEGAEGLLEVDLAGEATPSISGELGGAIPSGPRGSIETGGSPEEVAPDAGVVVPPGEEPGEFEAPPVETPEV